jgi:hypothetical protein
MAAEDESLLECFVGKLIKWRSIRMTDDKSKAGAADRSRINVNEDYEVKYWTGALNVSEEKLKDAVSKVGTSVEAVKKHLGR